MSIQCKFSDLIAQMCNLSKRLLNGAGHATTRAREGGGDVLPRPPAAPIVIKVDPAERPLPRGRFHNSGKFFCAGRGWRSINRSRFMRTLVLPLLLSTFLLQWLAPPAHAQAVSWTSINVGSSTTSSFSYASGSPPSYTVAGSGTGLDGSADYWGFTNVSTCNNIEIEAQLVSESSANAGAFAGLAIRDSYDIGAGEAVIGESVSGNVEFSSRRQWWQPDDCHWSR